MQRKARPQVGRPNASLQRKRKARPHVRMLGAPTQRKARPQVGRPNARPQRKRNKFCNAGSTSATSRKVGRPNATQGTSARWSPKRKTNPQRKRPHKGALG